MTHDVESLSAAVVEWPRRSVMAVVALVLSTCGCIFSAVGFGLLFFYRSQPSGDGTWDAYVSLFEFAAFTGGVCFTLLGLVLGIAARRELRGKALASAAIAIGAITALPMIGLALYLIVAVVSEVASPPVQQY